jgi:Flp pilus assembly protein CpaB
MAVAAVGVFVAYQGSEDRPHGTVVVAAHDLRPGQQIEADDLRLAAVELPADTRAATFGGLDAVVGRVVLGPVARGELLQRGVLTAERRVAANEIAITLPRAQVAVGRLKQGERVDVYVTYDRRTSSVVRGVEVVQIGADADRSVTSDRDVEIVVAVDSTESVAALVHALRTGEVTIVRSTFGRERADEPLVYDAGEGSTPTTASRSGSGA